MLLVSGSKSKVLDPENLALFISVILGASMVRQCLRLPGMTDASPETYAAQLRYMVDAALAFDPRKVG